MNPRYHRATQFHGDFNFVSVLVAILCLTMTRMAICSDSPKQALELLRRVEEFKKNRAKLEELQKNGATPREIEAANVMVGKSQKLVESLAQSYKSSTSATATADFIKELMSENKDNIDKADLDLIDTVPNTLLQKFYSNSKTQPQNPDKEEMLVAQLLYLTFPSTLPKILPEEVAGIDIKKALDAIATAMPKLNEIRLLESGNQEGLFRAYKDNGQKLSWEESLNLTKRFADLLNKIDPMDGNIAPKDGKVGFLTQMYRNAMSEKESESKPARDLLEIILSKSTLEKGTFRDHILIGIAKDFDAETKRMIEDWFKTCFN